MTTYICCPVGCLFTFHRVKFRSNVIYPPGQTHNWVLYKGCPKCNAPLFFFTNCLLRNLENNALIEPWFMHPNFFYKLSIQFSSFAPVWNEGLYAQSVPVLFPVGTTKFWQRWLHHHLTHTSFHWQHLSWVQRGGNLNILSRGCRVVAVTSSSKLCEALQCHAEATFHTRSCQA